MISKCKQKGFVIASAKINFIVYWMMPEEAKEIKIVLPEILFKKTAVLAYPSVQVHLVIV